MRQKYITPATRERLLVLRDMAERGLSKQEVLTALGFKANRLATLLARFSGSGVWPANIPQAVFDIPVHEKSTGIPRPAPATSHVVERRSSSPIAVENLAERIERDQAALHGPRMQHLIDEQRRYNLPHMGLLPEQMVA